MFAPGNSDCARYFSVSKEVAALGTTLYVLGFAFGPLVWAPGSEAFGRRWPICIGALGSSIFTIASATAPNIQTLLICRFFAGVGGSSGLSVVPGTLADLFAGNARETAICVYALAVFIGPFISPFVGGFIIQSGLGWRWTLYIPSFLGFLSSLLCILYVKETYPPVVLVAKAVELRQKSQNWGIHARREREVIGAHVLVQKYFTRPLRMLVTEPIILMFSLYMSFTYGLVYGFLEAYPIVFEGVYSMNSGVAGLPAIALALGAVLAIVYIIAHNTRSYKAMEVSGKPPDTEARLIPSMVGAVLFPVGLFWYVSPTS